MAVRFETKTPKKLLAAFKKAVDDGHIVTWSYDHNGDFTHTASQWKAKAWLRPKIEDREALVMFIVRPKGKNVSSDDYAFYHGHFIESMLRHCDEIFTAAHASAMPASGDVV